jgi:hypothetical protein
MIRFFGPDILGALRLTSRPCRAGPVAGTMTSPAAAAPAVLPVPWPPATNEPFGARDG